ncbi:MAG: hypothetical protein R3B99_26025 [Polyangiales bacterium]
MKRFLPVLLALSACGGGSSQLEPRYVAVHNAMSAMGLAQTGAISQGSLPEGAEARLDVHLVSGTCTTFVALGSSGVSDLDLRVVGEGDRELGRDTTHDRQAAAQVCADREGDYQVVVSMREGSGSYLVSSWGGAASSPGIAMRGGGGGGGPVGPGSCSDPIDLTLGQTVTGDTTNGARAMQGPCAQGNAPERVYRFQVPQRAQVSAQLQSAFDGALYLLRSCDLGSIVDCNDDAGDTSHSRLDTTLEEGTYFLVVDGYGDAAGAYELVVNMTPLRSVAEVCADAPALTPGRAQTGTTEGQADYFQATCAGGAASPDHVYRLDVPNRSRVRIRQNSDHDGALYLRSGCDDATTEIACNDDFVDTHRSRLTTTLEPGRYFVYADGYAGQGQGIAQGNFSVTAELGSAQGGGATGDTCAQAAPIPTGGTFTPDTFEASDDVRGSCGGEGAPDVVYALDVQSRSRLDAVVRNAENDSVVYVQRTCGDATTEVACTAVASSDPRATEARLTTTLAPGRYVLVFDGARPDAFGAAEAEVRLTDLAALDRTCRSAPMLQPGRTVNGTTAGRSDDFQATCAGNAQSGDMLYRLRVTRRSVVRITMTSDYDGALHLRRDCTDPSTELACNDDHEDNRHSRVEATLDPGTYFVVVDGFRSGSQGSFSLNVEMSRP